MKINTALCRKRHGNRVSGKQVTSEAKANMRMPAALTCYNAGRYEDALRHLLPAARTATDYSNVGALLRRLGRYAEAETYYRRALEAEPSHVAAHLNLGNLLTDLARFTEADTAFRTAIRIQPDHASAWNGLGVSLQHQGKTGAAIEAFQSATEFSPDWAEAHTNLGVALLQLGRVDEAQAALSRALVADPQHPTAHGNLAAAYLRAGMPFRAEELSRAAVARAPCEHRWLANLASALDMQGRQEEAEPLYRQALKLRPNYALGHGNLLFSLNYRADLSAEEIFAEYTEWDRRYAQPLVAEQQPFPHDTDLNRRLRIGYVSPDFREHAVALFAEPLLAAHDRRQFTLYCYSDVPVEDAATRRFRQLADHWRPTAGVSDADVAAIIRADQIDILIDLAGHSAGNRLLAFARKPAPVQVSYLLGHGYTSGLTAMDAFLADAIIAPDGSDHLFSEKIIRLPRIPLAYQPPSLMPPITPLPALTAGHITFGYFGRTERLNDRVIAAWSRILLALPGARLILNNRPFQEEQFCSLISQRFAAHGIGQERLTLVYWAPQTRSWAAYGDIDIALDPFPHNAGTTTIEALWQGVPVISLSGRPSVGRLGASILHALGLDDWATDSEDTYVARAIAAAQDLATLADLRTRLRTIFAASPLADASGLARAIESAYRSLWADWCQDDITRLRSLYHQKNLAAARQLADTILHRAPGNADAHHILGLLAYAQEDFAAADRHLRAAVDAGPDRSEIHANHTCILRRQGRLIEAEAAGRRALQLEPDNVAALNNLGNVLRDACHYGESAACYQAALRHRPEFADAWANLAWVLSLAGHAQQAEDAARQAIACDPDDASGYNNLGLALMRQGRLGEAEAALRQALALRPTFVLAHSNILFCLNYQTDITAERIFAEYRAWDHQHARSLLPASPRFNLNPSPKRRLRIGYVSPDFRQHAVAFFAEPLLAAHDRSAVEIYCYAEVPSPDQVTERFRAIADQMRLTVGMSDAAMAEQIRCDEIDVLVDLAGHTAGNRLLVFARKPAPVQITYLIGHGYSSGLSAMDAFLADAELATPGAEATFSERLVRLPRIPLAYAPPARMPPVVPLPALNTGQVTFGYFGRAVRLNDLVIDAWAAILRRLPSARLILNCAPMAEPAGRQQMAACFQKLGVEDTQLKLIFTSPQECTWAAYADVDIALDPFPHNAGTTTIEALWQGVPVVSLAGRPTVGRFGASILHAVGLDDWVTTDPRSYIDRAVLAATDLDGLAALRRGLRQQVAESPLCDPVGLAHVFEAVYRELWDKWRVSSDHSKSQAGATADPFTGKEPANCLPTLYRPALSQIASGDLDAAETTLRHGLAAAPNDAELHQTLGIVLGQAGRPIEAETHYRAALPRLPDQARALNNLAVSLQTQARHAEAEGALRQALELRPGYMTAHSNLLFSLNYRQDLPAEAIFSAYQLWDRIHATPIRPGSQNDHCQHVSGRRLRVGYVSPDFRQHAVAFFAEPLLAAHDRAAIELFCYAELAASDAVTDRFKAIAEHWRDTAGQGDDAVATMVRQDRIDVLVDLAGHSAGNRLMVFARKPAPVQIEYLLGHGYTSGLRTMDAFLADENLIPPGMEAVFSEPIVRLSRIPLAYAPPADMPEVVPSATPGQGILMFGYFGRPERMNASVVAAWAQILRHVPGSKLTLNARPFGEPAFCDLCAARFAVHGIGRERLRFLCTRSHPATLAAYAEIDIALDPFPHNAGTTTIEALWQGVPVVSLAGRPSVGRFGAMILRAVGLHDWVTNSTDDYVARAIEAARDIPALASFRQTARHRLIQSPLLDATGLARELESTYSTLIGRMAARDRPAQDRSVTCCA